VETTNGCCRTDRSLKPLESAGAPASALRSVPGDDATGTGFSNGARGTRNLMSQDRTKNIRTSQPDSQSSESGLFT
jgi:hypothetical protein